MERMQKSDMRDTLHSNQFSLITRICFVVPYYLKVLNKFLLKIQVINTAFENELRLQKCDHIIMHVCVCVCACACVCLYI